MLVQKLLLLVPWRPCQSKSPSTPNTHAPHWPLTPIVPPTRPPLTLKLPVELKPDGLKRHRLKGVGQALPPPGEAKNQWSQSVDERTRALALRGRTAKRHRIGGDNLLADRPQRDPGKFQMRPGKRN